MAFTDKINIRPFCEGDQEKINDFFDSMDNESRALFNRRDYNRRGALKFSAKPDLTRKYFIAELDEKMVGYLFFLDWNTSIPTLGLAVRSGLFGNGIGTMLVDYAIKTVKENGKGGIQLTTHTANLRAQMLYENFGFVCSGLCKNGTELFYLLRFTDKKDI